MPREAFERELQRLQEEMLVLASMVEEAITESVDSLKAQDLDCARAVDRRPTMPSTRNALTSKTSA